MFACIYIPDFPIEALIRVEGEVLRHHAIAALEGAPPQTRVVALNEKARQLGLEIGMTKLQAEAFAVKGGSATMLKVNLAREHPRVQGDPRFHLVRDSAHMHNGQEKPTMTPPKARPENADGAVLRMRSREQEAAAHAALLDVAHGFSPRIEDTAADTIVLDLHGLERLFGSSQKIARELARRVSELGMEANIAVAANPDTAVLAARGFAGTNVIARGKEQERLATLSIDVLIAAAIADAGNKSTGYDARAVVERLQEIHDTLERWGIRNLRALGSLPEISLSERLGETGVRLQRLARGAHDRALKVAEPKLTFEETTELEYPVDLLEPLAFIFSRLLEQLCARLMARALSTNELRVRLRLQPRVADEATTAAAELAQVKNIVERCISLPVPMNDARIFLKLLQLDLQQYPPGAPVEKIWITAEAARPRAAQAGLFMPLAPEPEKLELTLARIQGVVGEGRTGSAEVVDTHRPDAFRVSRFVPPAEPKKSRGQEADIAAEATSRTQMALRRVRPPVRVMVDVRDGRPARVMKIEGQEFTGGVGDIVWAAGPWRTSGEWWNGEQGWDCDQWDVAVVTGCGESILYRVYCEHGQWFIEGSYD